MEYVVLCTGHVCMSYGNLLVFLLKYISKKTTGADVCSLNVLMLKKQQSCQLFICFDLLMLDFIRQFCKQEINSVKDISTHYCQGHNAQQK